MTRDIRDRLALFGADDVEVRRLALNMAQIEQYAPPPNPAKETDSRFRAYRAKYGNESWELDALEPTTLATLVSRHVAAVVDRDEWEDARKQEENVRGELAVVAKTWATISEGLDSDDIASEIPNVASVTEPDLSEFDEKEPEIEESALDSDDDDELDDEDDDA